MVDYLLDTNTVSFALRGRAPRVVNRLRRLKRERVGISVVTAMELRYGVTKNPTAVVRVAVETLLQTMVVVPLAPSIAEAYGVLRAQLERAGTPIGALDTIIAAHAVDLGAILVTNNLREFGRVPGLDCEDWS
jgi:tRNA(fMet)-specific endonuclease VapC